MICLNISDFNGEIKRKRFKIIFIGLVSFNTDKVGAMACEERGEIGRSPRQGLKVPETWVEK